MYLDTSQDQVITRVVARLRGVLGLGESQCYETFEPLAPPKFPPGGVYLSVAPGDGTFDKDLFEGGGREQLAEESSFAVSIYTPIKIDHPDRAPKVFHDAARGLLPWKKMVLDALVGHFLTDGAGNQILRNPIYPLRSSAPRRAGKDGDLCMMAIVFALDYDWSLSDPEPSDATTTPSP